MTRGLECLQVVLPNYLSDATVFASFGGGLYRSSDGGISWTFVQHGGFDDIIVSPEFTSDQTIFIGSYRGLYRSTDGGVSLNRIDSGFANTNISEVALSPSFTFDRTVFASSRRGVYKSVDAGNSWTRIDNGFSSVYIESLAASSNFASDQTLFAGSWSGMIYKSVDGGRSWAESATGIIGSDFDTDVSDIAISPSFTFDQTLFAAMGPHGVFRSMDGGGTWALVVEINAGAIAVSPNYALDRTVFAGAAATRMIKSTDGGNTWSDSSNGIPEDEWLNAISISPNYASDQTLFAAGSRAGVLKSTDGGAFWSRIDNGFADAYVSAVAISPNFAIDQTVFAGTGGGNLYKSTDGGSTWVQVRSGMYPAGIRSIALSPEYAVDQTVLLSTGGVFGVFMSTNGGSSWARVRSRSDPSYNVDPAIFSPDYDIDKTMFIGTTGGGVFSFTYDPPLPFDLRSPADYATTWNSTSTFSWQPSLDAVKYQLYIDGSLNRDNIPPSATSAQPTAPLSPGNHTWYVKAVDAGGDSQNSTTSRTVIIDPGSETWAQVNLDGFGNSNNIDAYATGIYNDKLYMGTTNYYYSVDSEGYGEGTKSETIKVDTGIPTVALNTPPVSTYVSNTATFGLNWSGSDSVSGIDSYALQVKQNQGGVWQTLLLDTTATSTLYTGTPGNTYYFKLTARDKAGNMKTITKQTVLPYDCADPSVVYTGSWTLSNLAGRFLNTIHKTTAAGDTALLTFTGKQVALIADKSSQGSNIEIRIDGGSPTYKSLYSASFKKRQVIYASPTLSYASHTITIRNLATSGRPEANVDGIGVLK